MEEPVTANTVRHQSATVLIYILIAIAALTTITSKLLSSFGPESQRATMEKVVEWGLVANAAISFTWALLSLRPQIARLERMRHALRNTSALFPNSQPLLPVTIREQRPQAANLTRSPLSSPPPSPIREALAEIAHRARSRQLSLGDPILPDIP